jgi:hypothetical protein
VGNYYGPGMLYGDWLGTELGTKAQWEAEIDRSYSDNTKPVKLILSHNFAYYLDDLVEAFPSSKLVLCFRSTELCYNWWHEAGGWDISYPNYSWYEDNYKMKTEIRRQNLEILKFAEKHELALKQPDVDFFRQHFDIDKDFIFEKDVEVAVYG